MPGASHSKHSKHGQAMHGQYGQRKVDTQPPRPIKVIVCDDSRTAPAYFTELGREVRQYVTLGIVRAKCAASASEVVQRAIEERAKLKKGGASGDSVWALIDLEHERHVRRKAEDEKKRAGQFDVAVALSDPCFEVWTLLHLVDTGKHFANCDAVIKRIASAWKSRFKQTFPRKAQADYSKIIELRHEAACRARRHWEAQDPSRTEIYKVIEEIESHLPQDGSEASTPA